MELIQLLKTNMTVKKLLDGDAFSKALDAIAGVDISNAKYVIKNHTKYANPREALNAALDNLIHAHIALEKKYSSWHAKYILGLSIMFPQTTDAYICCLIAILHKKLGNSKKLIEESVDWAEKALYDNRCPSFRAALDLFNPIFWFRSITSKTNIDIDKIENFISFMREQEGFKPKIILNQSEPSSDYSDLDIPPIYY